MAVDVLILNTAVMDFRSADFTFVNALVGPGGLAKCATRDMPAYTQAQLKAYLDRGCATAGGPGNTAPLVARAGVGIAAGVVLGRGTRDGLDVVGRAFYDTMTANGVDMSATVVHPELPTGTTFICDSDDGERGGIGYFPNANHAFDFAMFKPAVERLRPRIVYYMYSGLSDRGDANGGRDLAAFMAWCRDQGAITIADSHTLTSNPEALIDQGTPVDEYRLLEPLLPTLDLFFTSADEAKMIQNTLGPARAWRRYGGDENIREALAFLTGRFWRDVRRPCMFGVTVKDGAYATWMNADGVKTPTERVKSRFMIRTVTDLVGAGDSFRAGFITYVARHADAFRAGMLDYREAIQMGNLMATLYVTAPLCDRYRHIAPYADLLRVIRGGRSFDTLDALREEIDHDAHA